MSYKVGLRVRVKKGSMDDFYEWEKLSAVGAPKQLHSFGGCMGTIMRISQTGDETSYLVRLDDRSTWWFGHSMLVDTVLDCIEEILR